MRNLILIYNAKIHLVLDITCNDIGLRRTRLSIDRHGSSRHKIPAGLHSNTTRIGIHCCVSRIALIEVRGSHWVAGIMLSLLRECLNRSYMILEEIHT